MSKTPLYDAHLEAYRPHSYIRSMEDYQKLYRWSVDDPESFWAVQANIYLTWIKQWDVTLRCNFDEAQIEWFSGGVINASSNCIDRHIETKGDQSAFHWIGDMPGQTQSLTYSELYYRVNQVAALLKSYGVAKGDRVILYMPRILELPIAMLACARIGAVHSVVFGGFSPKSLVQRINDCGARVIITADCGFRAGISVPYYQHVSEAVQQYADIDTVIVVKRGLQRTEGQKADRREVSWDEAFATPASVEPEPMSAEDPLFILYTSSPSGKPIGIVHTHGGYLLYAAMTLKLIFDLKETEVFWSTADMGWITGHTFGVYGPLLLGGTSVLFEGVPWHPNYHRYWEIIEQYRVNKFYTAPTVIRKLAQAGDSYPKAHDLSSLNVLGSAGDILNPEAWEWFYHTVGNARCPVVDTYWQIETGGPILTPFPGVGPLKPGSCGVPFFGIDPVILDDTGEEALFPNQEGVLCIRKPWPGMARTVYGDHDQYLSPYFTQIPGMFFTADEAAADENGYYHILGRIDTVINVSGHRLGAAEIEAAVSLHPNVIETAVVGYPHPIKGQGIYAFVALKPGTERSDLLKAELLELVRAEIGPIGTIDQIQWVKVLPKTRSGKILRHLLEKIAAGKVNEIGEMSIIAEPDLIHSLIWDRLASD